MLNDKIGIPQIAHLHFLLTQEKLNTLGLYKGQPQILKYIKKHQNVINSEIAKEFNLRPSTVTIVINRMISRKLVKKDERDKITLTKKGNNVLEKCDEIIKEIDNITYKEFTLEERETLQNLYEKIYFNINSNIRKENLNDKI